MGLKTKQGKNKNMCRDVKYRSETSEKFRIYLMVKLKTPHLSTSRNKLRPCSWSCPHSRPVYSIWAQFCNLSYQCFLGPLLKLPWQFLTFWTKFSSLSDFSFHWGQYLAHWWGFLALISAFAKFLKQQEVFVLISFTDITSHKTSWN